MNILQLGCNQGDDKLSEFLRFNKRYLSKVLLVDASASALQKAKHFYRHFDCIEFNNVAVIDTDEDEIDLFYPENTPDNVHCSVLESHVKKHKQIEGNIYKKDPEKVKKQKVAATRISKLLDYFQGEYIDRLYVDIEGLDCKIINDIDFEKYNIGYIRFEWTHSDGAFTYESENMDKTVKNLMDQKYMILQDPDCKEDILAIKHV
jgi:FkbM family methyltransferase